MAVGGLSERLAFILELDADGALSGFRRVGDTAERELGKADSRLDKLGGRMQTAGAGAVAFAGVAGRALFSFAEQSEDANLAQLKLQNSLTNNPKLAGENISAFNDLADAIQGKTAADGDQVVAGMAMLGTFKVTGDQLREITPLVVDYARKFGVDLVTANASVGKALDGQVGALKRNGVSIDETMFKTDRYRAVQEALARQVGGFAENEGATFSGRLQRLKNELGDVAEGAGVGAVDAFESMIDPLTSAADRLGEISPQALSAAGGMAAWATATIGAVGATSMAAGTLIKMRDRFQQLDPVTGAVTGKLNNFGKVAAGLGIAGTVIGLVQMGRSMSDMSISADQLTSALNDTTDAGKEHLDTVIALAESEGKLDNIVRDAAGTDMVAARALVDRAEANGLAADKVKELRDILDEKKQTDITGRENQAAYNAELDKGTDVTEELGEETKSAADKAKELADAISAVTSAFETNYEAVTSATRLSSDYEAGIDDLIASVKEHKFNLDLTTEAGRANAEQAVQTGESIIALVQKRYEETGSIHAAKQAGDLYVENLRNQLREAGLTEGQVAQLIETMGLTPTQINTVISANTAQAQAQIDEIIRGMRIIAGGTSFVVTGGSSIARERKAVGGSLGPGQTLVGEGGLPEIVERDAGGGLKVIDGQRTRSRLMSGGGSGGVMVNIEHWHAGSETPDELARALMWRVAG